MRAIWIRMILCLAIFVAVVASATRALSEVSGTAAPVGPDWSYVEKRLKKASFKNSFIQEMKQLYEPKDFAQVLELNVLLYLRKSDYHGTQVTDQAVEEVRSFMAQQKSALRQAESRNKVKASVVASLLWIESRHGRNQGQFHVPSVYLHLLQAERKAVVSHLKSAAPRFADSATIPKKQLRKIDERVKTKAKWALEELHALEKARKWKWTIVGRLRGSFSGAFGLPQFLPSSYVRWARSQGGRIQPDLSRADDAIESVAYFLRDKGWRQRKSKTHLAALMKYNNSRDYANAILALADRVDGAPALKRVPAGRRK